MKLLADSGSTKASWVLLHPDQKNHQYCSTSGINPYFQSVDQILQTLEREFTLDKSQVSSIMYYGTGVANEKKQKEIKKALNRFFNIGIIEAESDLLAAAHALCGRNEGIAAILGTGTNSCYYDGQRILYHVSPLGYILGDEGSGAVLGKQLLADVLKNQLPGHLTKLFLETYNLTLADALENVYRNPYPNRYLASFTRFLSAHIQEESLYQIVFNSFCAFFRRNIQQYPHAQSLPVHFTGSIAWHFAEILAQAASATGFQIGNIVQDPLQGLIAYHSTPTQ